MRCHSYYHIVSLLLLLNLIFGYLCSLPLMTQENYFCNTSYSVIESKTRNLEEVARVILIEGSKDVPRCSARGMSQGSTMHGAANRVASARCSERNTPCDDPRRIRQRRSWIPRRCPRAHYMRRYETRDDDGSPGDEQCILVKLNLTAWTHSVYVGVNIHTHTRACGSIPVSKDEFASAKLAQFALDAIWMHELQRAN